MRTCERAESGVVLIEFALVAAGAFLALCLLFDLGAGINEYLKLTSVAAEGAKMATRLPTLGTGTFSNLDLDTETLSACSNNSAGKCAHFIIHRRIRRVLQQNFPAVLASTAVIETYYETAAVSSEPANVIQIALSSRYDGILAHSFPIRAVMEGPYLFPAS